jgi:hypothetical protein
MRVFIFIIWLFYISQLRSSISGAVSSIQFYSLFLIFLPYSYWYSSLASRCIQFDLLVVYNQVLASLNACRDATDVTWAHPFLIFFPPTYISWWFCVLFICSRVGSNQKGYNVVRFSGWMLWISGCALLLLCFSKDAIQAHQFKWAGNALYIVGILIVWKGSLCVYSYRLESNKLNL